MIDCYVYHHLGLGDHLICNGLVRSFINRNKLNRISLVVKKRNLTNVQRMFRDRNDIEFLVVEKDSDLYKNDLSAPVVKIGFEMCRPMEFDKSFYDCVNIPFNERWDSWYIERDLEKEQEIKSYLNVGEDYIFVHDKSSTGDYKLNIKSDLQQIKPDKIPCESSIFDWIGIIENAKEIHAINSSFVHLIDSVKTNGKLYYHNKPNMFGFSLKKNWDFVK
jgi:hypothetical protein